MATTGNVLLSYDVDKLHPQVKSGLEKLGYWDNFKNTDDPKTYHLPNTTMWHSNKTSNQSMADIKSVCQGLGAKLEKAVVVRASEFVGL